MATGGTGSGDGQRVSGGVGAGVAGDSGGGGEMSACLLVLLLVCGPPQKPHQRALRAAGAIVAFGDTWTTQRALTWGQQPGNRHIVEANALAKPFQQHGPAVAYTSTYGTLVLSTYLEQRLRTSRLHWLATPLRIVQINLNIYGIQNNLAITGRR